MVQRATTLTCDPSSLETGRLLEQAFDQVRAELEVRLEVPEDVETEAQLAARAPQLPETDLTEVPFITIDPEGSMDLDQAMHLEREGDGFRLRYAIADVPAFVRPGGAIDAETRLRGQTVYCPDRRVPLHPPVISEDAASLLPDQVRPAFVWDIRLDARGEEVSGTVARALVRSVRRYTYDEVQQLVDAGEGEEILVLLREVGELRIQRESDRGGASLPMPQQEVEVGEDCGYALRLRPLLPAEDWNAQISLLTGMTAARIMLEGGVGLLRTLPAPDQGAVDRFRREVRALGSEWPSGMRYGDFLRTLDKTDPRHLAIVNAATSLFRGAGYTAFDGELPSPEEQVQAAIAAPYAHVTAPLRRLVDRFGLAVCAALSAGEEVPAWAREALPMLPELMKESDRRAKAVDRACVDAVEAAVMQPHVGEVMDGVVVDEAGRGDVIVQLTEPPVSEKAEGSAELGGPVQVRVVSADVLARDVRLEVVRGPADGGA